MKAVKKLTFEQITKEFDFKQLQQETVGYECDMVTVMRNGERVLTAPIAEMSKDRMVTAMLGRELGSAFPVREPVSAAEVAPLLEVVGVAGPGVVDASFVVRPGEIVGLLGLVGSGRTEIARLVFGAERVTSGAVRFQGDALPARRGINDAVRRGIAMVPEDRHGQGLFLLRSIRENVGFNSLRRFTRGGLLRRKAEAAAVTKVVRDLSIRPPDITLPVEGLSGGNQQKVLIGKWLIESPQLVILDEPTRGVDIGAKVSIYELIAELAASGAGVLLISSEHEEILNLADRAHLVSEGRVIGEIDPRTSTTADVLERLFAAQEVKVEQHVLD